MHNFLGEITSWLGKQVHPLRLLIELSIAGFAMWQIGILYSIFFGRLTYPMDLEWMEGGTLYEAYRILHGQPLYLTPVTTWAPYPYPPFHPILVAIVGLLHLDFWTGRLISIFFFSLVCAVIFREVRLHLGRSAAGIALGALSVAIICNAYPVIGQWYDLVRVDVMMFGLWVAGTARLVQPKMSKRHTLVTALLLSSAVFTKQTAALFVAWSCLFLLFHRPRLGLRLAVYTAGLCLAILLYLQWATKGAFWYLTVSSLEHHEIRDVAVVEGFQIVFKYAPFMVLTPFILLLAALKGWLRPRSILWAGSFLLAIPGCLVPYAKVGAYLNALIPLIALAGPAFIFVLSDCFRRQGHLAMAARWATMLAAVYFVYANPVKAAACLPGPDQWRSARELNALVASLPSGVVSPDLGFLPARNGHGNPHWQSMVVWDAIWRNEPMNEVAALEHSGARWVLLHSRDGGQLAQYVRSHSRYAMRIPDEARVRMVTGASVNLDEIWERVPGGGRAR